MIRKGGKRGGRDKTVYNKLQDEGRKCKQGRGY
jgi:hypothetical protein